jgi:hypothetical protein
MQCSKGRGRERARALLLGCRPLNAESVEMRSTASVSWLNRTPKSELWLAEFTDPDANQLALMSEVAPGDASLGQG